MNGEKKEKKKGGCLKTFLIVLIVVVILVAAGGTFLWKKLAKVSEELNKDMEEKTLAGQECPDFEVTTTDGQTLKMSEILKEKEALCIVLFATWCKPCEKEFPGMDKVYQKYQDKLGMIGLDVDFLDEEEDVKKYAESHKFTFPIARADDKNPVVAFAKATNYPTTLIVDRNGKVGLHRIGGIPDAETFEKLVTPFLGDDYQERTLAYYTFYAYSGDKPVPGVEFTVTSEKGTETYVTDDTGVAGVINDKPEDLKVKVTKVPDGFSIEGSGELNTGIGSRPIALPVR